MQNKVYGVDFRNNRLQEVNGTLQAKSNGGISLNCNNCICYDMQRFGEYGGGDVASTLRRRNDMQDLVVEDMKLFRNDRRRCDYAKMEICDTCTAKYGTCGGNTPLVENNYTVRRLTPLECERLQGFPDGWTAIGEWLDTKGKKHREADTPRYKALGNSIATVAHRWYLDKLSNYVKDEPTMASLFDGIGGFPYIWNGLHGDDATLWASEIEEFPIAVTKKHFPKMQHMGDITKLNGAELPPVSVVVGGSPCQDLSVAGKRAGLSGERSGLFMEQIRIIKEMREEDRKNGRSDESIRPRFMVWENVPGAFSSNKGLDFAAVIEETLRVADKQAPSVHVPQKGWPTAGCFMGYGYCLAWRVCDAQFWGVPQRRRRITLIADFGGKSAPEILFERKSLSGDSDACGEEWKGTPRTSEGSIGATSERVIGCFSQNGSGEICNTQDHANAVLTNSSASSRGTNMVYMGTERGHADEPMTYADVGHYIPHKRSESEDRRPVPHTGNYPVEIRHNLSNPVAFSQNQRDEVRDLHGVAGAIQAYPGMKQQTFVATESKFWDGTDTVSTLTTRNAGVAADARQIELHGCAGFLPNQGSKAQGLGYEKEVSPTLRAEGGTPGVIYECNDS